MGGIRSIWAERRGGLAIVATFGIAGLTVAAAATVDFSRTASARSQLEGALDSATIAAAARLGEGPVTEAAIRNMVTNYIDANLAAVGERFDLDSTTVTIDTNAGVVRTTASGRLDLDFAGLLGYDEVVIGAEAAATYGSKDIELALVLDVTGSMEGTKLADLKIAANALVDELLPTDGSMNDKVRIAVVPFAEAVNVGSYANAVKLNTGGYWAYSRRRGNYWVAYENSCATERATEAFSDASPQAVKLRGDASNCPSATILPLTNVRNTIRSRIDSFVASGGTAGHLGIGWGWYMISPNWADIWPTASDPVGYDDSDTLKIIVFMTDGDFNTQYLSANGASSTQAEAVCGNAKTAGVDIYTVGFRTSTAASAMMKRCASAADKHFDATSGSELIAAFRTIAGAVQQIYLSN